MKIVERNDTRDTTELRYIDEGEAFSISSSVGLLIRTDKTGEDIGSSSDHGFTNDELETLIICDEDDTEGRELLFCVRLDDGRLFLIPAGAEVRKEEVLIQRL